MYLESLSNMTSALALYENQLRAIENQWEYGTWRMQCVYGKELNTEILKPTGL